MTETKMGLAQARQNLSEIIENVQHHGNAYVVSRHGRPAAAIVPLQVYENWKQRQDEFIALIRKFQASSEPGDPDEIMREVLEAQQAVRAQLTSDAMRAKL